MSALRLKTLLGDHPVTEALKKGRIASARVAFDFADIKPPNAGFKRVVRGLEFDVAELAITTFLMAKAAGKPLRLLPAVVVGRFQHPYLVYNAERGPLAPVELAGKRVGVRSYSVTTGMWVRSILAEDYGVDWDRVRWVTYEEAHVAEFRDPPTVERAPQGKDMLGMLLAGEIDAAIVGAKPADPRIRPLIPDPEAAARAWRARTGTIQINHMVAVKDSVPDAAAAEVYRLLEESFRAAGNPDTNPIGAAAIRLPFEIAIDRVLRQDLIPRRFSVEELLR